MTRAQELAQTVTDAVSELVWAGRLVWADRVVGDQASCVVCGTFWPHHEEGCFAGELENNVKALAEAGERAREALRQIADTSCHGDNVYKDADGNADWYAGLCHVESFARAALGEGS